MWEQPNTRACPNVNASETAGDSSISTGNVTRLEIACIIEE